MRTMNPHKNWPMAVITVATIVVVVALFWAIAAPAIQDLHGALGG